MEFHQKPTKKGKEVDKKRNCTNLYNNGARAPIQYQMYNYEAKQTLIDYIYTRNYFGGKKKVFWRK